MSSFPGAWSDTLARARRLRAAANLIDRAAPAGPERADILTRLGRLVADLERLDTASVCRRCARTFVYSAAWFHLNGLAMPRHCDACRRARRHERRRAGVPNVIPPEPAPGRR
jgi:hypothetical protein